MSLEISNSDKMEMSSKTGSESPEMLAPPTPPVRTMRKSASKTQMEEHVTKNLEPEVPQTELVTTLEPVAGTSKKIQETKEMLGDAPAYTSRNSSIEEPKNQTNQIVLRGQDPSPPQKKYLPMEVYATVVAAFSFLCIGLLRAYTSPAIASMKFDHEFFNAGNPISKTVISWVAASPPLGSFFGTLLSGLALQYLGRQKTLVILTFPYIVGWVLIGFAKNIPMIMIGRVLTGLAAGFSTAAAQLYVSECVRAEVRGALGFVPAMMLSLGILLGFSISTINLEWQDLAILNITFPILLLLFAIAVPESPSWLLYRGREKEAIESLKKLRGLEDNKHKHEKDSKENTDVKNPQLHQAIEKELDEMRKVMSKRHSTASTSTETALVENGSEEDEPQTFVQFVFQDLLGKREIYFPAFISISLMVFQQLTGANAVIYYLSVILNESDPPVHNNNTLAAAFESNSGKGGSHNFNGSGLDPNVSSVIFGLVQFFAFFLSLPLIDRLGRRVLLIASALFMIFPHLLLGLYFYIKMNPNSYIHVYKYASIIKYTSSWFPLTCLCGFIASYSIGFSSVPFILMSEVFPSSARSYMCALASLVNHLTLFFIIRVFPTFLDWFGPHVIFWIFAVFCFLAMIHVAIWVPETRGKTLAEIELEFIKKDNKNSKTSAKKNNMKDAKGKTSKVEQNESSEKCQCCNK